MSEIHSHISEENERQDFGKTERRELSEAERQKIKDGSLVFLESSYKSGFNDQGFEYNLRASEVIERQIASLVGEEQSYAQGKLRPLYRQAVGVFLEELINFVEKKASKEADKDKLRHFLVGIQGSFFSYSPNISNQVGMEDLLLITAKANRVPEAQGWFGQTMVGELVYELAYCGPERVRGILEKIKKQKPGEVLDIINQLQTIGADAIAQGGWAEKALDRTRFIIQKLKDKSAPIVSYAADLSLERIAGEEQNPSLGVVTYHGKKEGGRLAEINKQELAGHHTRLSGRINPDIDIEDSLLAPIASDAVAVFDQSNFPRFWAKIDNAKLPKKQEVSIVAVRNARYAVEKQFNRFNADKIMDFINERFLKSEDPKVLAEKWAEVSSVFVTQGWQEYFKAEASFQELRNAYSRQAGEIQEQAGEANEALTEEFLEEFKNLAPKILQSQTGIQGRLGEYFENFLEQSKAHNLERMFTAAESFASILRYSLELQEHSADAGTPPLPLMSCSRIGKI